MTEKKKRHLHLVSDDTEYKDYALSALDEAIYDAITSEADEYDIYNTIMTVSYTHLTLPTKRIV